MCLDLFQSCFYINTKYKIEYKAGKKSPVPKEVKTPMILMWP